MEFFRTELGRKLKSKLHKIVVSKRDNNNFEDVLLQGNASCNVQTSPQVVTHTVVELTQPLLEDKDDNL